MSTPHADVDDRLARVKLSSVIEPRDLRVTGLVSELGAGKVLDYLEAAGEVENHWGFGIGQELARADSARLLEQAARTASRACVAPAHCTSEAANPSGCGSGEPAT